MRFTCKQGETNLSPEVVGKDLTLVRAKLVDDLRKCLDAAPDSVEELEITHGGGVFKVLTRIRNLAFQAGIISRRSLNDPKYPNNYKNPIIADAVVELGGPELLEQYIRFKKLHKKWRRARKTTLGDVGSAVSQEGEPQGDEVEEVE